MIHWYHIVHTTQSWSFPKPRPGPMASLLHRQALRGIGVAQALDLGDTSWEFRRGKMWELPWEIPWKRHFPWKNPWEIPDWKSPEIEMTKQGEIYGEIEIFCGRHLWSFTENFVIFCWWSILGLACFMGLSRTQSDMESGVELTLMARMLEYQTSIGWERGLV